MSKIVDFSKVSPQRTLVQSYPSKPDPKSDLFIERDQFIDNDGRYECYKITGIHLVIKKGHEHRIWDDHHIQKDEGIDTTKRSSKVLMLFCDTLEISGEFNIPETDIAIFARKLIWADNDASINTTPLNWKEAFKKAQPCVDGEDGRSGGNIYIGVSEVITHGYKSKKRLIANGGVGQDAGAGKDGKDGISKNYYDWANRYTVHYATDAKSTADIKFRIPATWFHYAWYFGPWDSIPTSDYGDIGDKNWPTDGENATPPGRPGNGGNGGDVISNSKELIDNSLTFANLAGKIERKYIGGGAGTPTHCAHYDNVKLRASTFEGVHDTYHPEPTSEHFTKKGRDADAPDALKGTGESGKKILMDIKNAWIHPLNLQRVLEYIRVLFLSNERDEAEKLLLEYQAALSLKVPKLEHWNPQTYPEWVSAKNEIASMLQNIRNGLDYFGNIGGYIPFFSLPGSLALYEKEREQVFKTLLLSNFVQKEHTSIETRKVILEQTIDTLGEASKIASQKVVKHGEQVEKLKKEFKSVEKKVEKLHNDLNILRSELKNEARGNREMIKSIKFTVNMAATIASVIPVGQPVLGAVASFASVASDYALSEDKDAGLNALEGTASIFKDVGEKFSQKMEALKEQAAEIQDESAKDPKIESMGKWADASSGIGDFIAEASENLKMLRVDKSEVEAELKRIQEKDPRWKKLTARIKELNEQKANIILKLDELYSQMGENYGLILSNSSAIHQMRLEKKSTSAMLSSEAVGFVRQMEQRSRLLLMKYTYLMVKSYETTLYKPFKNNDVWYQVELMRKLSSILKKDFEFAKINDWIEELRPAFESDLQAIRADLLEYLEKNKAIEHSLIFGLTSEETPELLKSLNSDHSIVIDPFKFGIISSKDNQSKIKNIILDGIEFEENGPQPVDTKNFVISLRPLSNGTMRKDENLYSVNSKTNFEWRWNYLKGRKSEIEPSKRSDLDDDMINFILGDKAKDLKQKVSMPPVWSNYEISLIDLPYQAGEAPIISKLTFRVEMDVVPVSNMDQSVVVVSSKSSSPLTIIDCTPEDSASRTHGTSDMVRIYNNYKNVVLKVPAEVDNKKFAYWKLNNKIIEELEITVETEKNPIHIEHIWKDKGDKELIVPSGSKAILMEPKDDAEVLKYIEPDAKITILKEEGEWKQINYKGTIGWIK